MTIQPTPPLLNPPRLEHGFVQGRYVKAVADTLIDQDRYPDLIAMKGKVTFRPIQGTKLYGGDYPAKVIKQTIETRTNAQGYIVDMESDHDNDLNPGVWLAVGQYEVRETFPEGTSTYKINVTGEYDYDNPHDLTLKSPVEIPPGWVKVVTDEDRIRAENAALKAEGHEGRAKGYADAGVTYSGNAAASASAAKTSETNAKTSETNSAASATAAKTSETNAKTSETRSKTSETNASNSATAANTSETNAKTSETRSKTSETNAKSSETKADASQKAAKTSETNAANSASAAKTSETNSATSESAAKTSETKAKTSETNAKNSETAAKTSETNANTSETRAKTSETNAASSATAAAGSATSSAQSATDANKAKTDTQDIVADLVNDGFPLATPELNGLMRMEDKAKLDQYSDRFIFSSEAPPAGMTYEWAGIQGAVKRVDGVPVARNYYSRRYLSDRDNWTLGGYSAAKDVLQLEPNTEYTFFAKEFKEYSEGEWGVFRLNDPDDNDSRIADLYNNSNQARPRIENYTERFMTGDSGRVRVTFYDHYSGLSPEGQWLTDKVVGGQIVRSDLFESQHYFDGNTPDENADKIWVDDNGIYHDWVKGAGWVAQNRAGTFIFSEEAPPAGVTYEWEPGTGHSLKKDNGVVVGKNLELNGGFQDTTTPGWSGQRHSRVVEFDEDLQESVLHGVITNPPASYTIMQLPEIPDALGQAFIAWGFDISSEQSGVYANYRPRYKDNDDISVWGSYFSDLLGDWQRRTLGYSVPNYASDFMLYVYIADAPSLSPAPPENTIVSFKNLSFGIGNSEEEALAQVETFFDGDTPDENDGKIWINNDNVFHRWVKGEGWVEMPGISSDLLVLLEGATHYSESNQLVKRNGDGYFHTHNPSADTHPANKRYVDSEVSKKANTSHIHSQVQVTGLTTALNDKADNASLSSMYESGNNLLYNGNFKLGWEGWSSVRGDIAEVDDALTGSHVLRIGRPEGNDYPMLEDFAVEFGDLIDVSMWVRHTVGTGSRFRFYYIVTMSDGETYASYEGSSANTDWDLNTWVELSETITITQENAISISIAPHVMAGDSVYEIDRIVVRDGTIRTYVDTEVSKKANTSHTHTISNVTGLQAALDSAGTKDTATPESDGLMSASDKLFLDSATDSSLSRGYNQLVKRNSQGQLGIADPTSLTHAATKRYVDDLPNSWMRSYKMDDPWVSNVISNPKSPSNTYTADVYLIWLSPITHQLQLVFPDGYFGEEEVRFSDFDFPGFGFREARPSVYPHFSARNDQVTHGVLHPHVRTPSQHSVKYAATLDGVGNVLIRNINPYTGSAVVPTQNPANSVYVVSFDYRINGIPNENAWDGWTEL